MNNKEIKPSYEDIHDWEFYGSYLTTEYVQAIEEGLDIESYKDLFTSVSKLPKSELKKELCDVLFKIVSNTPTKSGYKYNEPSDLDGIKALRKEHVVPKKPLNEAQLYDKIYGAWLGRICGCFLGKPTEGVRRNELEPFLKESGNFPMHRYISRKDSPEKSCIRYSFTGGNGPFEEDVGMPIDDDTNYVVLAQNLIEKYGKSFTSKNVAEIWLESQPKSAYCTAERVAFCNFIKGYQPPYSATYQNPFREWIGAQIRGDYFGYINPGDPEKASEMAHRDACISHVKNGIYGEMFVSAMIATAANTDDIKDIILSGLGQIPATSRLFEEVSSVLEGFEKGAEERACFDIIHKKYDEYTEHGWCHTIPNAMIVAASLLYGKGDFGRSICMAVETGFDTDCNGATVGSVLGMRNGAESIPSYWTAPINDTLHTSIFGVGAVKISERAKQTIEHIKIQGE